MRTRNGTLLWLALGAIGCLDSTPQPALDEGAGGAQPPGSGGAMMGGAGQAASGCGAAALGSVETRTRFDAPDAPAGDCYGETQTRTCTEAGWTGWSGSYPYDSCVEHCDGEVETRVRYQDAHPTFAVGCESEEQTRTCFGVDQWHAWTGSFAFEACTADAPRSCGAVPHGEVMQTRQRYEVDGVGTGESCAVEMQEITCLDGAASAWSGTFEFTECQESRVRFAASTVPEGEPCVSEVQHRNLVEGEPGPWSGSYAHDYCVAGTPADCEGGQHGEVHERTRYASATASSVEACLQEVQTQTCVDGQWSAWSGSYSFETCEVVVGSAGSCTFLFEDTPYACLDFLGVAYTPASVQANCPTGATRRYSSEPCTTQGQLLGICHAPAQPGLPDSEFAQYYYGGAGIYADADSAQADCEATHMGATWEAR